ncbi:hypothetical protein BH11MYX1_BH11MYX1_08080 [soil metagenome]
MSITQTTATTDPKHAAPDPQVVAPGEADRMVLQVGNDPAAAADLIRKHPTQRDALLAAIHARMGNGYVQQVIHALGTTQDGKSDEVTQLVTINADCVNESSQLVQTTGPATTAIAAAVKRAHGAGLDYERVATAFGRAETSVKAARRELDATSADGKKKAEYTTAQAAARALETTINQQATNVLRALTIEGVAVAANKNSGESYEVDVRARGASIATKIETISKLVAISQTASHQHGAERKATADQVRQILLSASAGDRAYASSVMQANGIAPDILDYYRGKSLALRTTGGPVDLGAASNSSAEANAQAGFSHATAMPNLKGPDAAKSAVKSGTADATTGEVGAGFATTQKGGATGGGSVDLRGDDGSLRFEGLKGELGGTSAGKGSVKASGGYAQTTSPPAFDGVHWSLAWSVSVTAGASASANVQKDGPVSRDGKFSGTLVKSGVKLYDDQASAQKACDDGAFALTILGTELQKVPDASQATALKEGESITVGHSGNLGGGLSGGGSGVAVGIGATIGGGESSQVTKGPGGTVVITVREVVQHGASGSVSTTGLSEGGGLGGAAVTSTTAELDLATDAGKVAYAEWLQAPTQPPKARAGVKILSTGSGAFRSSNIGIGVGVGPVSGTGTNTSTTGEFTETSADKQHSQSTIVGTQTDATKGFNPINADKNTRSDSLEIKTTDGKTDQASYTIKTSIAASQDQQWQGGELEKVLGESNKTGKLENKPSGAYSVEGTYTSEQMKKFESDVATGKVNLTSHGTEATNPGATLKAALGNPASTEHDKQVALANWYAARGPEANADLRTAVGPPEMSITLANDKYLTGNVGKAAFEGKRQELEDRFLDPAVKDDPLKQLLRDVQSFYAELMEKRDHIANPANYPELPVQMRHTLVQQVQAQYAKVALLRARVAARCKEQHVGDDKLSATMGVDKKMATVRTKRETATVSRRAAVDQRAKHNGALSAGHGSSPREELDRTTVITNDASKKVRELYQKSDAAWVTAIARMTSAEEAERTMFKEDCLTPASALIAIAAAEKSAELYEEASREFISVSAKLATIKGHSGKAVDWSGADARDYGTLD